MSDVFAAIADPTRREILDLLRGDALRAGDIAERFPEISRPAVSRHLRVLRAARLCRVRASGRERRYELDPRSLADVDAWLARYRSLWSSKLHSLKSYVEGTQPATRPRGPRAGRPVAGTPRRATAPTRRASRGARGAS
ncbi:MAG TPA: metalloregulator ArsR/SmtB family transcription factor [Candidatus Limnocylindria bacterium]|nr:metalloregulator ArsR/SmtB family transcription factor [Candidatus Limnocylindria bacterium]